MKNKTLKKFISIILCLTVIAIIVTGCKGVLKKDKKHEELTINNGKSFISEEFFKMVKDKYPEIRFDVSNYAGKNFSGYARETLKNGDIPDIYMSTLPFDKESQKKYLIDLSGYNFINNYTTKSLNQIENDGEIYLLPTNIQLAGISYNKTLMEKHGWDIPSSFKELKELAPKIEAEGYDVMRAVFNLDGYPFNFFFNIGNTKFFSTTCGEKWKNEFITGEAKAKGNESLLSTARYFKKWIDEGFIKKSELDAGNDPYDDFMNGKAVFYLGLGLTEYEYVTQEGKKFEFGVMPWLSENGNNNMLVSSPGRFFGISKELTKKGNEQKLEDALKILEYISTQEGQEGLVKGYPYANLYITSLKNGNIDKNNPFYSMKELIDKGNVENLVYLGWENLIVKIAHNIKRYIKSEISDKELLKAFDKSYIDLKNDKGVDVLAKAKNDMSIEDATRICGIAQAKATNAEVAIVSHGSYDREEPNPYGVNWYFYKGNVDTEVINMFATECSSLTVIEMKGNEIKKLVKDGFSYYKDKEPFKYSMFVKDDKKIKDNKTYKVVVGTEEINSDLQKKGKVIEKSNNDVVREYVKTLGEFSSKDIKW